MTSLLPRGPTAGEHRPLPTLPRTCARPGLGTLSLVVALAALAPSLSPLSGQDGYPASDAGAPGGVYAAPRVAIDALDLVLASDSLDYGANWRMAGALMTLGALAGDAGRIDSGASTYQDALRYAYRAARAEPDRPEGHYMIAQLLGRISAGTRFRDRFRTSSQVLEAAQRAVEADSTHDGAWHQLGRWHTQAAGLPQFQRLAAIYFLDGDGLDQASFEEGVAALERAVKLRPKWIAYRLDLAHAYIGQKRFAQAREQLKEVATLEQIDPEDASYVRQASALDLWVARKTGEAPPAKFSLAMLLGR